MGLDDEIILSDIFHNQWYLNIKYDPKENKLLIINSIINALENEKNRLMCDAHFLDFLKTKYEWNKLLFNNDISTQ
jgi:hypothetical protein